METLPDCSRLSGHPFLLMLSQLPWSRRLHPWPSLRPLFQTAEELPSAPSAKCPEDPIHSNLSTTPPTRKRPVQLLTVSPFIIPCLHGQCGQADIGVIIEL